MSHTVPLAVSAALSILWGCVLYVAPNLLNVAVASMQFTEYYIYYYLCSKGKIT
jgi:uncharacterized membrane protein